MKATLFHFTLMCPTKGAPRNFATICLQESLMMLSFPYELFHF